MISSYNIHFCKEIDMGVATVTSKGQITIPVDVREKFGIEPGDRIEFVSASDGTLHLRIMDATAEEFFNCLLGFGRSDFVGTDQQAIAAALGADVTSVRGQKALGERSASDGRFVSPSSNKSRKRLA
jgi:antitoxin PrlF